MSSPKPRRARWPRLSALVLCACGASPGAEPQVAPGMPEAPYYPEPEAAPAEPQAYDFDDAMEAPAARAAAPAAPSAARSPSAAPRPPPRGGQAKPPASSGASGQATAPPAAPAPSPRMVFYEGQATLRVTTPREAVAAAVRIVEKAEGYVEQRTDTFVILRLPVREFRPLFDELLALGEVTERSVSAQDITDAYTATELRLRIQVASRDRLIALLAKAKNEHEKLQILREIKRLTEQIDQLEVQVQTLASLAAFSRVTLRFVPKGAPITQPGQEPIAAFRFIHQLSPFKRDVASQGERLEVAVPKGMVMLSKTGPFVAESADGAVLWASKRPNDPKGDAAFWIDAIAQRLAPGYRVKRLSIGPYQAVELVDAAAQAYRYLVLVRVRGADLELVEVYYPSAAHEARYDAAVRAALGGGGVS